VLTDQVIDLMDERTDVAIRVGPMRASQLMVRKLGQSRMVVVAAPASPSTSRVIATSGLSSSMEPTCLCRLVAMLL
jgi:DNA-binding transcriptional LysR family regulator